MREEHKAPDNPVDVLEWWTRTLGLRDWAIRLLPDCPPDEMSVEDATGCADWNEINKAARIEILEFSHYGERVVPYDWEKTLVHELLHLKLCLVSDHVDELQSRYMHQIIDDLARAFVFAKRTQEKEYTDEHTD